MATFVKLTLQASGKSVWISPDAVSHVGPYTLDSGHGASTCTGITMVSALTIPVQEDIELAIALLRNLSGGDL